MANYWQDRFVQLEKAQMNKGIEYYHELEKQYSKAAEEVQKEIMKWYGRLAKNNEISVSEARKLLTKDELQEFKWSVETYIQKGKENDIDGRWMKELENASAKVHINRLEAMKLQMQQQVEMLYGNEIDSFDKHIRDTYTEGFYRTAYEIQKGLGVGTNLAKLDTEKINKIIAKPWTADGSNFSSRIWKQKNQLVNELHNGLSQAFIRGTEPYDLTKQISERFKVSKGQAGRLVMTETAYFHSAAQIDAFKELGVKEYEITAVLDSRTSELCRDMDGKHLPVSEFKAGITAPPFHCWCRSTTVPYFNDDFTEEETRIARGADDKLYEVPYNMTYREWEKKFVDGDKAGLKEFEQESQEVKIGIKANSNVNRQYVNSKDYHDEFVKIGMPKDGYESAYTESKLILDKANGYDKEYLTAIDTRTGQRIATTLDYEKAYDNTVDFNPADKERVYAYKGGITQIHNHSKNGRPSGSDIVSCFTHKNVDFSIIACHDGDIFVLSNFNRKVDVENIYKEYYNDEVRKVLQLPNDAEIPDRIRKDLKNECKIKATTRMYKLNEEEHFFIIRRYGNEK